MDLLLLLLLIQVVFFISKGQNYLVLFLMVFAGTISRIDKRQYVFIGLSMIITQIIFIYITNKETREPFKFKMKKAKKFMKKNAKYGLLAAGPLGVGAFAALEANKRRKENKKKRKEKKKRNRAKRANANPIKSAKQNRKNVIPKSFNAQMDLHKALHKRLNNTMKNHVTAINNIHSISK